MDQQNALGKEPNLAGSTQKFLFFLKHFIQHANCSVDHPTLLILDNHESHISLDIVKLAKKNGIEMLTLPPHNSHKFQPLDKAVYDPFKTYYNQAVDARMRSNCNKTFSIYDIPECVNQAYISAMTPRNIVAGFASTGIFPYNRFVFTDADFTPSLVSDRPNPEITHNQNQPTDSEEASTENIDFTAVENAATSLNANDCQNTENQIAMPTDTDTMPHKCLHPEQQSQLPTTSSSPITEKQDEQHTFGLVSPKEIMPLPSRKSPRKQRKKIQVTVNCQQNIGHHKFIGRFLVALHNFCFCCNLKKLRLAFCDFRFDEKEIC